MSSVKTRNKRKRNEKETETTELVERDAKILKLIYHDLFKLLLTKIFIKELQHLIHEYLL